MARERLTLCSVVANVVYSILLLSNILLALVGLLTYSWVETTDDDMLAADVYPPEGAPGLNKVSCGIVTYCIDAAGAVSDCSIPWPTYGSSITDIEAMPSAVWAAAGCCIAAGIGVLVLAWLYSVVACFGCFHRKLHGCCVHAVELAGLLFLAALVCFGYALGDLKADRCRTRSASGDCNSWYATLPSARIEGAGNQSCRICPDGNPYQMSTSCKFGWGGIVIIAACALTLVASCVGGRVQARKQSWLARALNSRRHSERRTKNHRMGTPAGGQPGLRDTVPPDNGIDRSWQWEAAAAAPARGVARDQQFVVVPTDSNKDALPPPYTEAPGGERPRVVQIDPDAQYGGGDATAAFGAALSNDAYTPDDGRRGATGAAYDYEVPAAHSPDDVPLYDTPEAQEQEQRTGGGRTTSRLLTLTSSTHTEESRTDVVDLQDLNDVPLPEDRVEDYAERAAERASRLSEQQSSIV